MMNSAADMGGVVLAFKLAIVTVSMSKVGAFWPLKGSHCCVVVFH
jgi:hypothetical protein